jgi:hypothetical protein
VLLRIIKEEHGLCNEDCAALYQITELPQKISPKNSVREEKKHHSKKLLHDARTRMMRLVRKRQQGRWFLPSWLACIPIEQS